MRLTFEDQSTDEVRITYEVASMVLVGLLMLEYGPRVYEAVVQHDDDCPKLSGGECTCHYVIQVDFPD